MSNTERDELTEILESVGPSRRAADAILDAGYRKIALDDTRQPQHVTSRAHLNDLEDPDTILTDYLGNAYQWGIGLDGSEGWQSTRDPHPITSGHLLRFAPLAVLRVGAAK